MQKIMPQKNKIIYFDNAATTPVRPAVLKVMQPYFSEQYGNPSSIYDLGEQSKAAIKRAREQVARTLGADTEEIFFTGSGTEADNWALKGIAFANKIKGRHIITTSIEHHAVLNATQFLEEEGFKITYLPVDEFGVVKLDELKKAIRKDTILISVMFANNEIGTIEPIKEIGKIAKQKNIYFHSDAVQAIGHIPIDVEELGVDLLSLSAHKFNGPKGVGCLYIKNGTKIDPFIHGGGQERKMRAGTENVAGIVGLGKAIEIATRDIKKKNKYLISLRERALKGIIKKIPEVLLNGHRKERLPGNLNIGFKYIEGESILLLLNQEGICASTGSACTSGSLEPSHVLLAIGASPEDAHGSLRLSFSETNTAEEIGRFLKVLPEIVKKLRLMSPLKKN